MKRILSLLLSLFSIYVYAQNETTKVIGFKRLYVGVSTTQGISYRLLQETETSGFPMGYTVSERNDLEKPSYACNVGINIGVRLTKFIAIETGLAYSHMAYSFKLEDLTFGSQWNGTGFVAADGYAKIKYNYHYLDIPLGLHFSLGKNKVKAAINTGTYFNVLLNNTRKWEFKEGDILSDGRENNTTDYARFNISPFLGIGIDYQISSLMSLRIMPIAQFQALRNINDKPITEHLYAGGIHVALNFGFIDVQSSSKK